MQSQMFLFHLSSLSDKLPEHNNRLAKYEMAQESIGTNIVHNNIIIPTSSLAVIIRSFVRRNIRWASTIIIPIPHKAEQSKGKNCRCN